MEETDYLPEYLPLEDELTANVEEYKRLQKKGNRLMLCAMLVLCLAMPMFILAPVTTSMIPSALCLFGSAICFVMAGCKVLDRNYKRFVEYTQGYMRGLGHDDEEYWS